MGHSKVLNYNQIRVILISDGRIFYDYVNVMFIFPF